MATRLGLCNVKNLQDGFGLEIDFSTRKKSAPQRAREHEENLCGLSDLCDEFFFWLLPKVAPGY